MLNLRMYWQLKVYTWIFLIGFGCWGVLNTSIKTKTLAAYSSNEGLLLY